MALQRKPRIRFWIWTAVVGGLAVHAAAFFLLRLKIDDSRPRERKLPEVVVISDNGATRDQVARERLELLNPEPLVAPTRWNAGAQALPAELRRQPGEEFDLSKQERMTFPTDRLATVFAPPATAPASPAAALDSTGPGVEGWGSFGQVDRPFARLPARDAGVEISRLAGGAVVVREGINGLPDLVRARDWEPLEFSIVVATEGLIGVPSVAASSGVEAIDAFFREFLVRQYRIGERVAPGFYRVVIVR